MKLTKIDKRIVCDSVLCGKYANYALCTDSFRGDTYLCSSCLTKLKNLFKRNTNDEQ